MKTSLLIIPLLLFSLNAKLIAQKVSEGIYLSAEDFSKGKLSFPNVQIHKTDQLRVNNLLGSSLIIISKGDSVITLKKDSIFGYQDKENRCYRFYKNSTYEILNPAESILLYSNSSLMGTPNKTHRVTNYYFSVNARSPIYPLTLRNIEILFYKDVHFKEQLEVYFHFNDELTVYDSLHKMYFLNRIYEESKLESEQAHNKIIEYEGKCSIFNGKRN